MGYQASLDYLYSLQRFGIKLGLENTARLLERLGNPQDQLRIVHIAGTNGKGSTAAALASIFCQAGLQTGLYTSPHLHSFSERIQLNGQPLDEQAVVALVEEIRPIADELGSTFFEFATALALLCFQRHGMEWVVLEVGMGGRLDATNVVHPELILVTPIDIDHAEHLGATLGEIAAEKAGVFKPRVPVVTARQQPAAAAVLRDKAERLSAPFYAANVDYSWQRAAEGFDYCGLKRVLPGLVAGLAGEHQRENLSLALAAAELLQGQGVALDVAAMRRGVAEVRWPGRLEWLGQRILFDGAHNPAGARVLCDYLTEQGLHRLHCVLGLKAGKAGQEILKLLVPFCARLYLCPPPVEEPLPTAQLLDSALALGATAAEFASPELALKAALASRKEDETVLIAGSLFLVAALREEVLTMAAAGEDIDRVSTCCSPD